MATSYAEAAREENKYKNKNDDCKIGNVKPIFLLETDVFGENDMNHLGQRPFLINIEVYRGIKEQVPVRALIGLQRVRGIWPIYFDNGQDKKELLSLGLTIRKKSITLYLRNPKVTMNEKPNAIKQKEKPKNLKRLGRRPGISRYLTKNSSHDQGDTTNSTPKQSKTKNIEKSPVTPTENLHDATRDDAAN
ncbi:Hypothetical predicted protein [Mytilus galloprovincialis]|uniref:Uncharacterized protein n=1 Tax=Mytilus galloprovincialis TaxID=29158 RepID=A0A8B6FIR3_MYTGA|nr:Hypothetical predicted protein [Mytilus galloprovincialis]